MTVDLSGKIALVTGASRGIGAEVAKAYAAAGAHVILLARTVGGLEEIDDAIQAAGGQATLMPFDMAELDKVDMLGPTIAERFGGLDIAVGNAAVLGTLGPLPHDKAKEWDRVLDINLNANFRLTRTLDPLLQASDAGRLIMTSSGLAKNPRAYWGAYCVSKAGLETMIKVYAAETEKTNLRVNLISPGVVDTAMIKEAFPGGYPDDDIRQPKDIVPLFLHLADPACERHGEIVDINSFENQSRLQQA